MSTVVQIIGRFRRDFDNLAFHRTMTRCDNAIQISPLSSLPASPRRSKTNPFIPNDAFRLLETVAAFIPQDVFGMKGVERTTQFYADGEYFAG